MILKLCRKQIPANLAPAFWIWFYMSIPKHTRVTQTHQFGIDWGHKILLDICGINQGWRMRNETSYSSNEQIGKDLSLFGSLKREWINSLPDKVGQQCPIYQMDLCLTVHVRWTREDSITTDIAATPVTCPFLHPVRIRMLIRHLGSPLLHTLAPPHIQAISQWQSNSNDSMPRLSWGDQ